MGKKPGPTLRAQWLGQQLRELREEADMTLRDAGEYLQRNPSMVSRFESAETPIRRGDVTALLDLYGVADTQRRAGLLKLSQDVWQKGWWEGYADDVAGWFMDYVWLENRAREIRSFDDTLILGLLQTKDYARAAITAADPEATEEQVDRWVELRTMRQHVLRGEDPPTLRAILDESLLHRMVGGRAVMRAQLARLLEATGQPHIEIRVLPLRGGAHASPTGTFKLLTMPDPYPEVAYTETLAGAIYVESPETERFIAAYDLLWEASLPTDQSAELISATLKESE